MQPTHEPPAATWLHREVIDTLRERATNYEIEARRLRCRFGFHRWAYMGEALARSTPHIAYEVNQVCVGCRVLRFNPVAPGRPAPRLGDWRRKPKPDGGQIYA